MYLVYLKLDIYQLKSTVGSNSVIKSSWTSQFCGTLNIAKFSNISVTQFHRNNIAAINSLFTEKATNFSPTNTVVVRLF